MALTLSASTQDTAVAGNPSTSISVAPLNFPVDFFVKKDVPGELLLTNKTCPVDKPEIIRVAVSEIKDIYTGSGINPSLYTSSRRGTSILLGIRSVMSVTDSVDSTYENLLPFEAHMVIKVPNNNLVTPDVVAAYVKRLFALGFETGSVTSERFNALVHNSLKPLGL